jgi:hypothetical protein
VFSHEVIGMRVKILSPRVLIITESFALRCQEILSGDNALRQRPAAGSCRDGLHSIDIDRAARVLPRVLMVVVDIYKRGEAIVRISPVRASRSMREKRRRIFDSRPG